MDNLCNNKLVFFKKNTHLLLHKLLSMDGREKGHGNYRALKELDDKQQNHMERPDDCKCLIREEGDKDKEEVLNLQQRNIGVDGGQKAAAMKSSSKEDDDNGDSSSSEPEGEVSIVGSLLCT